MDVYISYKLHISPEKFYLKPVDSQDNEVLVIDKVSREISLQDNESEIPASAEVKSVCGIFGIIDLLAGPYLVVITDKILVGEINGEQIWKAKSMQVYSYSKNMFHLNERQVEDNTRYVTMLEHALAQDGYYFSATYDVTHTMQRLQNTSPDFLQIPLHERGDVRFVWNSYLLREMTQQKELARFCIPVLLGFVSIAQCSVAGRRFVYAVVSRRSCFRAGTRYYMRGIDSDGHAANYVETEQIVESGGDRCSYVQTRGSVPLFWSQYPNLKYKPNPEISSIQDQKDGFQRHFATQIYCYGKQVIVNLLDQKGQEIDLTSTFGKVTQESNNSSIKYEPFDFHRECRNMRWDRLTLLTDRLAEDREQFGYFMVLNDGAVVKTQSGVFRTNCIDCLDRTNVVQSLFAKHSLQDQLVRLEILDAGARLEDHQDFLFTFNNVWADNADVCAKQYAGTGALKTDFTRSGKRTILGLLKDGYNSSVRYVLNNFFDGFRQDSIDLILGNYIIADAESSGTPSPLLAHKDWKYFALPAILLVAISMCTISLLLPAEHLGEQVMYVVFWGGASLLTLSVIYLYGAEFVDRPRLAQLKFKTD